MLAIAAKFQVTPVQTGEVQLLADRLRAAVAASLLACGSDLIPLRCSIGVSCSEPGEDVDSLIQRADQARYDAKALGRDGAWQLTATA